MKLASYLRKNMEEKQKFCRGFENYSYLCLGTESRVFLKDNEYDKKYYYLLPAVIAECGGTGTGNYRQCNHRQRKYTDDKAEADGAAW